MAKFTISAGGKDLISTTIDTDDVFFTFESDDGDVVTQSFSSQGLEIAPPLPITSGGTGSSDGCTGGESSVNWESLDTSEYVAANATYGVPTLNATIVNGIAVLECTNIHSRGSGETKIYELDKKYWPISSFVTLNTSIYQDDQTATNDEQGSTQDDSDLGNVIAVTCPICDKWGYEAGSAYVYANGKVSANVTSSMGYDAYHRFIVAYPCRALVGAY